VVWGREEEFYFDTWRVLDRDFGTYTLPHFSWVPKIDTVVLDSPEATGAHVLQLPLTKARVKAALAQA